MIRGGRVEATFNQPSLKRGIAIAKDTQLVVARGRTPLPARPGDQIQVITRSSSLLDQQPNVLGGGPLLQNGRVVLNGRQEDSAWP